MKFILFVFIAVGLLSCSDSTNPKFLPYTEPPKEEKATEVGDISKESFRPNLDIIFVIDNSGSMSGHQQKLASNIDAFGASIVKAKFLDYHVGVINSSMGSGFGSPSGLCCGRLNGSPTYIERTTPSGLQILAQNVKVGTNGDANEKFFDPLQAALSVPLVNTYNVGFYRDDSYLVVLFITDTDDQSMLDPTQLYDYLVQLKGSPDRFFIGAAFIPDADLASCAGDSEVKGYNLEDFFALTNATTFSLCDPDYGSKLAEIGKVIALQAQTMYLQRLPKQGTIKIKIGKEELIEDAKKGWSYNPVKNAIEFGDEIEWDKYPDNTYPSVDYDPLILKDTKPKPKKKF